MILRIGNCRTRNANDLARGTRDACDTAGETPALRSARLRRAVPQDSGLLSRAFTLVELILVMAMLMIVLGVAFPSLQGFFRGRNLDSEARRFLSLTRYGQSRAVSEGVPMLLWVSSRDRMYGLQVQTGYTDLDQKAVEFNLDKDVEVEAITPQVTLRGQAAQLSLPGMGVVPAIRFTPDGFIGETSIESIVFRQGNEDQIWITQSTNRLRYEILPNNYAPARLHHY